MERIPKDHLPLNDALDPRPKTRGSNAACISRIPAMMTRRCGHCGRDAEMASHGDIAHATPHGGYPRLPDGAGVRDVPMP